MIPPWLVLILDRTLPNLTGAERDAIAEAIYEGMPLAPLVSPMRSALQGQLVHRAGIALPADALEAISRNLVQSLHAAIGEIP